MQVRALQARVSALHAQLNRAVAAAAAAAVAGAGRLRPGAKEYHSVALSYALFRAASADFPGDADGAFSTGAGAEGAPDAGAAAAWAPSDARQHAPAASAAEDASLSAGDVALVPLLEAVLQLADGVAASVVGHAPAAAAAAAGAARAAEAGSGLEAPVSESSALTHVLLHASGSPGSSSGSRPGGSGSGGGVGAFKPSSALSPVLRTVVPVQAALSDALAHPQEAGGSRQYDGYFPLWAAAAEAGAPTVPSAAHGSAAFGGLSGASAGGHAATAQAASGRASLGADASVAIDASAVVPSAAEVVALINGALAAYAADTVAAADYALASGGACVVHDANHSLTARTWTPPAAALPAGVAAGAGGAGHAAAAVTAPGPKTALTVRRQCVPATVLRRAMGLPWCARCNRFYWRSRVVNQTS
jgi:hypothetical protein